MAVSYILDGYNITIQIPSLSLKNLKASREGLLRLIEYYRPQGSRKNEVTIVFDGKPGVFGGWQKSQETKMIFSENESADDKIRELVEHSRRKKEIIVVTDDKELAASIRILGAEVSSVKDFLAKAKKDSQPETKDADEKRISKTLEFEITEELGKIWIKDDKKS